MFFLIVCLAVLSLQAQPRPDLNDGEAPWRSALPFGGRLEAAAQRQGPLRLAWRRPGSDQKFGDSELYLEFMISKGSNSRVYMHGLYEFQVFDSYGSTEPLTSSDCGGICHRWIDDKGVGGSPSRNASRLPGEWQCDGIRQAQRNERDHGISFSMAPEGLADPNHIVTESYQFEDEAEQRHLAIGMTRNLTLVVVVSVGRSEPEVEIIHIISARKAVAYEQSIYEEQIG
jgi:uncharacterized DUF497 family protein